MRKFLDAIDDNLMACLFLLMGMGLTLASVFLYTGFINGDNWTVVCTGLFGSSSIGTGLAKITTSRTQS